MENLTSEEKKALDIMKKDNFRGISKDNVMQLVSILDKVEPEVAKELIAQIPDAIRGMVEIEKKYNDTLSKGLDSLDQSAYSCYQTEDDIIKSLQREIDKDGVSFEEKQFYYEKMENASKRKAAKDSEHRNYVMKIMDYGAKTVFVGLLFVTGLFIGKTDIAFPSRFK